MIAVLVVGIMIFLLIVQFLFVLSESVRRGTKEIEGNYDNIKEEKKNKHWTKEELIIVAYYVLFEKQGLNEKSVIESLSEGIGRSYNSIVKKVTLMQQVLDSEVDNYGLLKDVVLDLKELGKKDSEILLNESIHKALVIN